MLICLLQYVLYQDMPVYFNISVKAYLVGEADYIIGYIN